MKSVCTVFDTLVYFREKCSHNFGNFPPHHREDNELVRVNLLKLPCLPSVLLKKSKYLVIIKYRDANMSRLDGLTIFLLRQELKECFKGSSSDLERVFKLLSKIFQQSSRGLQADFNSNISAMNLDPYRRSLKCTSSCLSMYFDELHKGQAFVS